MTELSVFGAVTFMIVATITKGYTTKTLTQLRLEGGRLTHEEARARQELAQAEVVQESTDALRNQAEYDCTKLADEIVDLARQLEDVAADLGRSEIEDQEE
jgi:hypothetical protein